VTISDVLSAEKEILKVVGIGGVVKTVTEHGIRIENNSWGCVMVPGMRRTKNGQKNALTR